MQKRAEFRALILDVQGLPETQRSALLLREIDALAYEEIAVAMETTVPAVKSLLVRARISLADASQGRHLTCDEVHLELAEATEGLRKMSGPARFHMKDCERCREYRTELRRNEQGARRAGADRPARRARSRAVEQARHRRRQGRRRRLRFGAELAQAALLAQARVAARSAVRPRPAAAALDSPAAAQPSGAQR